MPQAYAHTNIALVKYWGKRDGALNLPAVGSLSLTLDRFGTWTRAQVDPALAQDVFTLDGAVQEGGPAQRVRAFLDLLRARAGRSERLRVDSRNDVPTAAGLASSASAFAALSLAAAAALEWTADAAELSALARQGSGSAARSLWGGFVRLDAGTRADGTDCLARPLAPGAGLDVRLVVLTCASGPKDVASTEGMLLTQRTSPYFGAWVDTHRQDLERAVDAVTRGDLPALGDVMEHSTLKMHASAMAAVPGVLYWRGVTLEAAHAVRGLRRQGVGAWFTMDAGPHVKVLCSGQDASIVAKTLGQVPGVLGVDIAGPGPAARLIP